MDEKEKGLSMQMDQKVDLIAREKISEVVGQINMAHMIGSFVNAVWYKLVKDARDTNVCKMFGMDWKTLCREKFGRDQKTINAQIKFLEEFGESFIIVAERIGLRRKDLFFLYKALPEDTKAEMRRGVLKISGREFKVEDIPDEAEEFMAAVNLMKKEIDLAKREARIAENKFKGVQAEAKKTEEVYTKQIKRLEAQVKIEDPEEFAAFFKTIEKSVDDIVVAANRLNFKAIHGEPEDEGLIKARYLARINTIETQFNNIVEELKDGIFGR